MLERLKAIGPSVVRTVSPYLLGLIVTGVAHFGFDWTPGPEALAVATWAVGTAWYVLVRYLETHKDSFGWLLSLPWPPSYDAQHVPASPGPDTAARAQQPTVSSEGVAPTPPGPTT